MDKYQQQLNNMTVKELKTAIRKTENVLQHYQNPTSSLYNLKSIKVAEIKLAAERTTLECLLREQRELTLRDREKVYFNSNYKLEAITMNIVNNYWAENDD